MIEGVGHVSVRHDAAQVMVTHHVLGQQDEVPTRTVNDVRTSFTIHSLIILHRMPTAAGTVRLHTYDGFERNELFTLCLGCLFAFLVNAFAIIK